ncbi:beta-ketoacyl synthase N-terminal-like domain-containing protein [Haloferula sp.]|uniref:beta-ketoacyl synthase N-terminal-like domain-containing protein n=1 Tax=Haloferula sp. TaxID=2497595 RepID=UPI00329E3D0E
MSGTVPISITGCGALSVLGHDVASHLEAIGGKPTRFRPLSEMAGAPTGFEGQHAGWIEPRSLLAHRKWSPLSAAAIHVAREALASAAWTAEERRDTAIFFGTSRGALAGWSEDWPGRRPFRVMAASNSLSAEPAAAVGSEFGIEGPWQVQSSGCCSGLDALGMAKLWLDAGHSSRALVISVDLPLTSAVLQAYADTGILSSKDQCEPLSAESDGMIPSEGAAAICLEAHDVNQAAQLMSYQTSTESGDPLGGAAENPALVGLMAKAIHAHGTPELVVLHASGTRAQFSTEPASVRSATADPFPMLPMKQWTGHTVGASGLLESALITAPAPHRPLADYSPRNIVFKIASSMGGKHSLVALRLPS